MMVVPAGHGTMTAMSKQIDAIRPNLLFFEARTHASWPDHISQRLCVYAPYSRHVPTARRKEQGQCGTEDTRPRIATY
jgi:hypothetical protein